MLIENCPYISVVMAAHNEEKFIKEAICSILGQTFGDFEFIIVDDFSDDQTVNIIKSYNDKRIKLITNESNIGLTVSLNEGIKLAKGKYIARMDADDISLSSRLLKQKNLLDKNPHIICVGTLSILIDEKNKAIRYGNSLKNNRNINNFLLKDNILPHGSVMFRKNIFDKVKGYRKDFCYAQDYDLWLRFIQEGNISIINEHLYMHRVRSNSISIRKLRQQELFKKLAIKLYFLRTNQLNENKLLIKEKEKILFIGENHEFRDSFYDYYIGLQFLKEGNVLHSRRNFSKKKVLTNFKFKAIFLLLISFLPSKLILLIKNLYWVLKEYRIRKQKLNG